MRSALLALLICIALPWNASRAQGSEPQIYFFWSASCPYSQAMRALLQSVRRRDGRLRIREFEVDRSARNMELLGAVYGRIGMPDLLIVPLVVIGPYAIIGYADEAATEKEILDTLAECRAQGCADGLRDLIRGDRGLEEASAAGDRAARSCRSSPFAAFGLPSSRQKTTGFESKASNP